MGITINGSSAIATPDDSPATNLSHAHTIGTSGSNTVLLVGMVWRGVGNVPTGISATYAGAGLTLLSSQAGGAGTDLYVATWYKTNPASGTNNISLSWTNSGYGLVFGRSYYGVDQSSPFFTPVTTGETLSTSISQVVTSTNGGLAIDLVSIRNSPGTVSVGANQSALWNGTVYQESSPRNHYLVSSESATGSSTTMSWSWTVSEYYVGTSVCFNPAPEPVSSNFFYLF